MVNQLPPPMPKDPNFVPQPRDPDFPGPHILAEVILHEGQLKEGRVQGFTVRCDENPPNGTGSAPSPLGYFTSGIGFWMATHLVSVARRMEVKIENARVQVRAKYYNDGSVLQGNRRAHAKSVDVEVFLDTDIDNERIAALLDEAEQTCFTVMALRDPVPVEVVSSVNGKPFDTAAELRKWTVGSAESIKRDLWESAR